MNYSLSDTDLLNLCPNSKIVKYNDLIQYKTIDQLLDKPCFILFETVKKNQGHWICLWKEGDTVYFFDSYGLKIEEQKKYVNKNMLVHANYISQLMKKSPYKVDYNPICYQGKKSSTCGRHCAIRIACKSMGDKAYQNFMQLKCRAYGNCSPDEIVCAMTLPYLQK